MTVPKLKIEPITWFVHGMMLRLILVEVQIGESKNRDFEFPPCLVFCFPSQNNPKAPQQCLFDPPVRRLPYPTR